MTVTPDVSIVTGLYTELNGTYSEITAANTKAAENTTYYRKGKWVTTATNKTTTVTLTKGTVGGDVYGGGYGLDGVAFHESLDLNLCLHAISLGRVGEYDGMVKQVALLVETHHLASCTESRIDAKYAFWSEWCC